MFKGKAPLMYRNPTRSPSAPNTFSKGYLHSEAEQLMEQLMEQNSREPGAHLQRAASASAARAARAASMQHLVSHHAFFFKSPSGVLQQMY